MNGLKSYYRFVLIMGCSMLLIACVDTQWVKPGSTAQEREHQLTRCEAQALKDLPPDNHVENRITQLSDKSSKHHKKQDLEETTDYEVRDANEQLRDVLINDCMYHAGWEQQEVK